MFLYLDMSKYNFKKNEYSIEFEIDYVEPIEIKSFSKLLNAFSIEL